MSHARCLRRVATSTRRVAARTADRLLDAGGKRGFAQFGWTIAGAFMALSASACNTASAVLTPAHRAAIVDSVEVMLTAWRDALNAKDFARAATFYSNDPAFRWFEDRALKYRSGPEIGDTMRAAAPGFRSFAVSLIEPQVTALAPGVAVVTSDFVQKATDTTGQTVGFAGALSMTVVHGDSGWKFLVGHTSSLVPPAGTGKTANARRT